MREKILTFIEKNSRIDIKELAIILGEDELSVAMSWLRWKQIMSFAAIIR